MKLTFLKVVQYINKATKNSSAGSRSCLIWSEASYCGTIRHPEQYVNICDTADMMVDSAEFETKDYLLLKQDIMRGLFKTTV